MLHCPRPARGHTETERAGNAAPVSGTTTGQTARARRRETRIGRKGRAVLAGPVGVDLCGLMHASYRHIVYNQFKCARAGLVGVGAYLFGGRKRAWRN